MVKLEDLKLADEKASEFIKICLAPENTSSRNDNFEWNLVGLNQNENSIPSLLAIHWLDQVLAKT